MELIDQQYVRQEQILRNELEKVLREKKEVPEDFRAFAYKVFRQLGKSFTVRCRLFNGRTDLTYDDIAVGSKVAVKVVSFDFNPQTSVLSNNVSMAFVLEKQSDLESDLKNQMAQVLRREYKDCVLEDLKDDKKAIATYAIEKKINRILEGIFIGDLVFGGEEFKTLIERKKYIDGFSEQYIERLATQIQALNIINSSVLDQESKGLKTQSQEPLVPFDSPLIESEEEMVKRMEQDGFYENSPSYDHHSRGK